MGKPRPPIRQIAGTDNKTGKAVAPLVEGARAMVALPAPNLQRPATVYPQRVQQEDEIQVPALRTVSRGVDSGKFKVRALAQLTINIQHQIGLRRRDLVAGWPLKRGLAHELDGSTFL